MRSLRPRFLLATSLAVASLSLSAGLAAAQGDPVGTPGQPNCHGLRVSTGNQRVVNIPPLGLEGFRLTPPHRVQLLNTFQEGGRTDWTVQGFQDRVRESCQAPTTP
jgi:hypothetical protein